MKEEFNNVGISIHRQDASGQQQMIIRRVPVRGDYRSKQKYAKFSQKITINFRYNFSVILSVDRLQLDVEL